MSIDFSVLELRTTELVDGVENAIVFDLLYGNDGFTFKSWKPQVSQYKEGGVFQDSPFVDGRKLVFRRFANAVETISLSQKSDSSDLGALAGRTLVSLLEKAGNYQPSSFSKYPVYLAMRPRGQTEEQYALIVSGSLPELEDPWSSAFTDAITKNNVWVDISLVLERGHWMENPPEQGTAVPLHATQSFNSVTYGNVDSSEVVKPITTPDVFMANKHVYSNLTNIHLTTTGPNRIGGPFPFDILPSGGSGSRTYFGVDSSIAGSSPFNCLIFDISQAMSGTSLFFDFEYWNGTAWSNLGYKDNTEKFANLGVEGIYWTPPSNWATNTPGGGLPTGWWVRLSTAGTVTVQPRQQNRNIYTVSWPSMEIDKGIVGGEMDALMRAYLYDGSPSQSPLANDERYANWTMLATRRVDRGSGFTPYVNITFTAEDRPPNTSIITILGGGIAPDAITNSPTGRTISWAPATVNAVTVLERVAIYFSAVSPTDNIAAQWAGRYRVFLRVIQVNGSAGDLIGKLSFKTAIPGLNNGVTFHETEEVSLANVGVLEALDLGEVTIKENMYGLYISMWLGKVATGVSTHKLHMCDVVLMPVDEYSAVVDARGVYPYDLVSIIGDASSTPIHHVHMEMDGITQSNETRAVSDLTEGVVAYPLSIVSGRHKLTAGHQLRVWSFMQFGTVSGASVVTRAKLEKNQRYLTYRGKG